MERVYPEEKDDAFEVLAGHFDAADTPERAVHYYELASTRSLSRSAHEEAVVSFEAVLELAREQGTVSMVLGAERSLGADP